MTEQEFTFTVTAVVAFQEEPTVSTEMDTERALKTALEEARLDEIDEREITDWTVDTR